MKMSLTFTMHSFCLTVFVSECAVNILALMGNFSYRNTYKKDNTAGHKQSRMFLKCVNDNLLTQVIEETMKRGVPLDLVLITNEGLIGYVKAKGSLSCSGYETVEMGILKKRRRL